MGEKWPRILPKVATSTSLLGSFTCRKVTKEGVLRIFSPEKSDGFGRVWTRELGYQRPARYLYTTRNALKICTSGRALKYNNCIEYVCRELENFWKVILGGINSGKGTRCVVCCLIQFIFICPYKYTHCALVTMHAASNKLTSKKTAWVSLDFW
jgi:hypothetical protein